MKYCPKCKKVYTDDIIRCEDCKNSAVENVEDKQTPLSLCTCTASQREMLMATLKENGIVSSYDNQTENFGMAMEGYKILVPAGMYKKAYKIAVDLGMINIDEAFAENVEQMDFKGDEETFEEMSPKKRATVRVLSALALIVIFALVIFGVDYVMALIKNLFI